jgi:uncharacterized protein YyaL (SSP411 family)
VKIQLLASFALFLGFVSCAPAQPTTAQSIHWQPWSDDVFAQAKKEHKFVLMDLQAIWCHWCHVMDDTTYQDADVVRLINEKYIAVKVDQDSRPDISNRYEDYGWPATVVFNDSAGEIVKRRGYLEPKQMSSMLQAIIDDPTPGPSIHAEMNIQPSSTAALSPDRITQLASNIVARYDSIRGGWDSPTKFVDADVLEYCMLQAMKGDKTAEHMARQTLDANLKLIDPMWGGVDQYSAESDWDHPHFEKIMSYQADDLRIYGQAYLQWHDENYLKAAQQIHHFLETFLLSPQGAFYTSQDADLGKTESGGEYFKLDDAARRRLGVPAIDQHIYARENGWAIRALVSLYDATGDAQSLDEATHAARWIIANRSLEGGGFRHDENDPAGPYLGDTLAMGRAFLAIYQSTADRVWLTRADQAADFLEKHFVASSDSAGVLTSAAPGHPSFPPRPEIDENVATARFARLLFAYTGRDEHEKLAERAMRYLGAPQITESRRWLVGGILLANQELATEPLHVTVLASKADPVAKEMFTAALQTPVSYFRLEWYDAKEGPLKKMDVQFPKLPYAAGFICTGTACSSPVKDETSLRKKLAKAIGK